LGNPSRLNVIISKDELSPVVTHALKSAISPGEGGSGVFLQLAGIRRETNSINNIIRAGRIFVSVRGNANVNKLFK
jgi:hypothetical protein